MSLREILQELWGLFVDDGALALAVLAIVVVATLMTFLPGGTTLAGGVLVIGLIATLVISVLRAAPR